MKLALLLTTAGLIGFAPIADAATWKIDPAKSTLGFTGNQGGEKFKGVFGKFEGVIEFDPAAPEAGRATVTVDTASAKTGDPQKDSSLPKPDWFDVNKTPQARFEAKSFKAKGGDAFEAVGTLTIRGIAKELTLPFTLSIAGDTAHAKGHVELIRTQYGVGQGSWSTPEMVALEVGVDVDVTAVKAP